MRFGEGPCRLEIVDETDYSPGSQDNLRSYAALLSLEPEYRASSKYGIRCLEGESTSASLAIAASGGTTGVNAASCVLLHDRCFVAVGYHIVCLQVPELTIQWHVQGDLASCFGLFPAPGEKRIPVHGACASNNSTIQAARVWEFSGRDIFTGPFAVTRDTIEAVDFDDVHYLIDIDSGAERSADAG